MSEINFDELPPSMVQTICLQGDGEPHTIHGFEVGIRASLASAEGKDGSSRVKISTVTNQTWTLPSHHGNSVASNDRYMAYVLEGRSGYVLRLIQQETNGRALLKGFTGAVVDVAFAHSNSNLLAAVDQGGNVYVWDLDTDVSKMEQAQVLRLEVRCSEEPDQRLHRVVWCPYVPAEEEEGETPTLVATHGCCVDVFNLAVLLPAAEGNPRVPRASMTSGVASIAQAHDKAVCDLSLSPDGAVLATGGQDGHLKFWQILWDSADPPSCLHDFEPHKGAEVTRLMFCDNHLSQDPSTPFWRFLITASKSNSEIKVWCAVSWKCLQTVRFLPPEGSDEVDPHIILNLDLSASYLLATDAKRMALYVLQVFQSDGLSDASVSSVTEYLLTQPILSFVVAGHTPFLPADGESGDEGDAPVLTKDFDSRRNIVNIKLHCIHTRSMQELLVRFEPPDLLGIPQQPLPGDELLKDLVRLPGWGLHDSSEEGAEDPLPPPSSTPPTLTLDHTPLTPSAAGVRSPKLLTPSEFSSSSSSVAVSSEPSSLLLLHSATPTLTSVTTNDSALTPAIPDDSTLTPVPPEVSALTPVAAIGAATAVGLEFPPHPLHNMTLGTPTLHSQDNTVAEGLKSTSDTTDSLLESERVKQDEAGDADPGDEMITAETEELNSELKELKSGGEEEVSESEAQQSLNNIFSMLQIEAPPTSPAHPEASYEEFAKMLLNPVNPPLTSTTEEGAELPRPPEAPPTNEEEEEDASKTTPSEYLRLLRRNVFTSATDEQLLVSDTSAVESEGEQPGRNQWPDIGETSSSSQEPPPPDHFPTADMEGGGLAAFDSPPVASVEAEPTLEPATLQDSVEPTPEVKAATFSDAQAVPVHATLELAPKVTPVSFSDKPASSSSPQPGGSEDDEGEKGSPDASEKSHDSHVSVEFQPENSPPGGDDDGAAALSCSLPQQDSSTASGSQTEATRLSAANDSQLAALYQVVVRQQEELASLRQEQQTSFYLLQQQLERVETQVCHQQRAALSEHAREQQQRLERTTRESKVAEKQRHEKLVSTLSATVTTKLDKVVKSEVKGSVVPAVSRSLGALHEQLASAVTQKVGSAVDSALRGAVEHMLQSKGLPEAIAGAVAGALQRTVLAAHEDALRSSLLPGFDHSCKEMFGQIDSAFRRGTTEYLAQVHQQSQGQQQQQTLTLQQQLLPSLSSLQHLLTAPSSPLLTNIEACVQRELATILLQTQQAVKEVVGSAVKREVDAAIEKHAHSLSPETRRQEERKQMQESLSKLIVAQQFDAAFEKALSTSDLQLVLYVCQQLSPEEVFDKAPSPLSQPVLLSLIQQLSVDFKEHIEIKLKYLENSVMALDSSCSVTRSHMVPVLSSLRQQLAVLEREVQGNPALSRQLKKLSMLAQAATA